MSQIIFLNGCGSSGKTSIAKAIGRLSSDTWLTIGIDTFIDMLPLDKHEAFLKFIPGKNDRGPTMRVESGGDSHKLFGVMARFAELLANEGNNLIIDEVLFEDTLDDVSLKNYAQSLIHHTVYYMGVFCDLRVMQEREILRRDRCIGLSNAQIDRVHQGIKGHYDFKVDTSHITPFEAARLILKFMDDNLAPQAFKKLRQ